MSPEYLEISVPVGEIAFPSLSDKSAGNLRVYSLWREQIEKKDKCFNSAYKSIIYQITVS